MKATLGRLERVPLRTIWEGEASDFTPWLAGEANLDLLAEALGLELFLEGTEVPVGPFKADILCRVGESENRAIIENQFETTNHDHLGKIITYASGLNATTVVWIAERITDEHRQALTWLNEYAKGGLRFFGVQIEAWRIGDSEPAPRFHVVVSPNEWSRTVRETADAAELTPVKALQLELWTQLQEHLRTHGKVLKPRKPAAQHWYELGIGRSGFHISLVCNTREKWIGCELYINHENAKTAFQQLHSQKEEIQREFADELDWQELPAKHDKRIAIYRDGDVSQRDQWPRFFEWFRVTAEKMHAVFSSRIRQLNLEVEEEPRPGRAIVGSQA